MKSRLLGAGTSTTARAAAITLVAAQASRYLVIDFGTSQSPKSTRQRDSHCAPAALRPPRDPTPRWYAESHGSHTGLTALGCGLQHGLWRASARRPCLTAWRLPGTTGLGLRPSMASSARR